MRFLVTLVLLYFGTLTQADAQKKIVSDTLGYLKHIEARKGEFIGQPFSNLLSKLRLGIVTFCPIMSNPSDVSKEPSTTFMFLVPTKAEDYNLPYLSIIWQSPLDFDASDAIASGSVTFGGWNSAAITNYKNAIVGDIVISGAGTNRHPPEGGWVNWKDLKRRPVKRKSIQPK